MYGGDMRYGGSWVYPGSAYPAPTVAPGAAFAPGPRPGPGNAPWFAPAPGTGLSVQRPTSYPVASTSSAGRPLALLPPSHAASNSSRPTPSASSVGGGADVLASGWSHAAATGAAAAPAASSPQQWTGPEVSFSDISEAPQDARLAGMRTKSSSYVCFSHDGPIKLLYEVILVLRYGKI
jgi:hypothetical protein